MKFAIIILAVAALNLPLRLHAPNQPAIPRVIASGTRLGLVQESVLWAEGPVGSADGGLYFNDVRNSRMYRLDPDGKITTLREDSGGANGMALTKAGDLYAVEGAEFATRGVPGRRVSHGNQTGHPAT